MCTPTLQVCLCLQEQAAARDELAAELSGRAAALAEREVEAAHQRAAAAVLDRAHGATVAALQGQLEAQAAQARAPGLALFPPLLSF